METMNIALPQSMKSFVQTAIAGGDFSSASEYVRSLIRADQRRRAQEALEAEIVKGLQSGESTPMTSEDWDAIRRQVRRRHAEREQA